jgi:hypothetical protein
MHAAHRVAAANVSGEAATSHPTTATVPAALRPEWYREHQCKRRNGDQATHFQPL